MTKHNPNGHFRLTLNRMSPTDSHDARVSMTTHRRSNTSVRSKVNTKTKESRALAKTSKNEVDLISDFTEQLNLNVLKTELTT